MNTLQVSIVTPNGEIYNDNDATLVVMNTHGGQVGIMANHVPMVTTLKISSLKIVNKDKKEIYFAVSEGFAECHGQSVSILVQTAEEASTIDSLRATKAKERAEERLNSNSEDIDTKRAQIALAKAINRLNIIENK